MPSFYVFNVFAYCLRKYTPPIKANITGLPVIPDSRFISTAYDIYILPHGILLSILSTNQHPIKELALEYARLNNLFPNHQCGTFLSFGQLAKAFLPILVERPHIITFSRLEQPSKA